VAVKISYDVDRGGDECDVDDGRARRMGRGAAVKMDPTISYVLRSRLSECMDVVKAWRNVALIESKRSGVQ
jgi:hypothetical protein